MATDQPAMRSKNKQFNAEMVRDIIAGRVSHWFDGASNPSGYAIGDVIWVRESVEIVETRPHPARTSIDGEVRVRYRADGAESGWIKYPNRLACRKVGQCIENGCWREAARIYLKITGLHADRIAGTGDKSLTIEFKHVA